MYPVCISLPTPPCKSDTCPSRLSFAADSQACLTRLGDPWPRGYRCCVQSVVTGSSSGSWLNPVLHYHTTCLFSPALREAQRSERKEQRCFTIDVSIAWFLDPKQRLAFKKNSVFGKSIVPLLRWKSGEKYAQLYQTWGLSQSLDKVGMLTCSRECLWPCQLWRKVKSCHFMSTITNRCVPVKNALDLSTVALHITFCLATESFFFSFSFEA
jgi:hypothetical protein